MDKSAQSQPSGEPAELSHADACRLGVMFTRASDLRTWQDQRINEWLKKLIAERAGKSPLRIPVEFDEATLPEATNTAQSQPVTAMASDVGSGVEGFTPGPWVIFADQGLAHSILPAGRPGEVCNMVGSRSAEREANARLIAAAPDLLAALQEMLKAVDAGQIDSPEMDGEPEVGIPPYRWHEEWAFYARAAISKALAPSTAREGEDKPLRIPVEFDEPMLPSQEEG